MTHAEAAPLLDAFVDDELDLPASAQVDAHVAGCAWCARERDAKLALRDLVAQAGLRPALPARFRRRPRRAGLAIALCAAAAAAALALWPRPRAAEEVVAAHTRALMSAHLTDVASTDQHTVKPWFQGKVPFGVPARDFAAQGFALAGGRLDAVGGERAAALVYRHGAHEVDLFVWPARGRTPPQARLDGYQVYFWDEGGLRHALVGDVTGLDAFARLLQEGE